MARRFITALAVTTVIATGISTASARAEPNNNFGDFLAATILLLAIGSALEGGAEVTTQSNNGYHGSPTTNDRWTGKPGGSSHGSGQYSQQGRPGSNDRWTAPRELPKKCQQSFTTQFGLATTFEKTCLTQNYRDARRLPKTCEQTLWTSVGVRQGYDPTCLRRQGYTVSRR